MRRILLALSTLAILTAVLGGSAGSAVAGDAPRSGYIVVFQDSASTDTQTDLLQGTYGFKAAFRYRSALRGFAAQLTANQAALIARLPFVKLVSPDGIATIADTAPVVGGETVPTGVRRIQAGTSVVAHAASTVSVAVIDTGVQLSSPDLNVTSGTNCVSSGAPADDDNGHGTHVSGTIAGRNTGSSVVGVAPGTKIYAVKVLDAQGSGTFSQIVCGIDWVRANASSLNIKVASMSLGGSVSSKDQACGDSALHQAICNATSSGVTFVVAAGNDGVDFNQISRGWFFTSYRTFVPAAYAEVLTVTAMSDSDGKGGAKGGSPSCRAGEVDDAYASFSNFAVKAADQAHVIAGPGVCILSDWPTDATNTISGTSMATPHLSGAVALCLGQGGGSGPCAGLAPAKIIQKMRTDAANHAAAVPGDGFTGDPAHPVSGRYYGYLVYAGSDLSVPPPSPTLPTAPSLTSATPGNASVGLAWTAPSSDGGATITGYEVYRGTSPGGESGTPIASLGNVLTYNDSPVTNGTTYYYKVAAVNSQGTGPQSNERSATPVPPVTTGTISGKVTISGSATAIGGATVSIPGSSVSTDGNGNYSLANVAAGGPYTVSVSKAGYITNTTSATVTAGQTTVADIALTAVPPTTGTLTGTVRNASGNAAVAGATVTIQGGTSVTTNNSGVYTFSNVTAGSYTVSASASGFTGVTTNGIAVTAGVTTTQNFLLSPESSATAPDAPDLSASGRGFSHGIDLSWTTPADNGSTLTGYRIYRSTASGGTYTKIATVGVVTTFTDTGNPTFRTSYYKVVAVNGVGSGPFSNVASAFSF